MLSSLVTNSHLSVQLRTQGYFRLLILDPWQENPSASNNAAYFRVFRQTCDPRMYEGKYEKGYLGEKEKG